MFINVNLASLKTFLGIDLDDHSQDYFLELQLNSGVTTMKDLLGRNLEYGRYEERVYNSRDIINLTEYPVKSITSFTGFGGDIAQDQYFLNKSKGRIKTRNGNGSCGFAFRSWGFSHLQSNPDPITVDYIAGYYALPEDLLLALYSSLQTLFQLKAQSDELGGAVKSINVYDVGVTTFATNSTIGGTINEVYRNNFLPYMNERQNFGNLDQECEFIEVVNPVVSNNLNFQVSANSAYISLFY